MSITKKRTAVSLILKCIVVTAAAVGTYLSAFGGTSGFMVGGKAFMYFTIQSNILIALICAVGAVLLFRKTDVKNVWFIVKYIGTVAITLTGAVFTFVLAPTLGDFAWQFQNILTHLVVPVAAIADFFVTGIYGDIQKKYVFLVEIPPIAYVIYAAVCYAAGWTFADGNNYPYFFLNWGSPAGACGFIGEFPFMGCVWWILIMGAAILAVGYIYILILNRMKRRHSQKNA
ncbi:MAG: Pr6Pr family membrane protein [Ruminococcus sp.]|uniref:Pr6Pr family membrane protein n=1 Tax=Ruminococcus sp. TaxID=41978 RepID=UPI002872ADE9|nr:Pr6Pr family membrane protein [Ruminococcus sp.]MBQ3285033.1 Pr6Pr family membrane protein [Ruminococcus sp.]